MNRTRQEKLNMITRYVYRSLVKMFTPYVSQDFKYLLEDLTENEQSFGRKIDQAYESLQETSRLVERLETELKSKMENVSRLKDEHQRYAALASIEQEKAKALLTQLDASINKSKVSERVIAFIINLVAGTILFIAGLVASPYLKKWLGITVGT
ncbi:hypothetical protein [Aquipseudomonas guryensis]|uniref:Uncharacterized protein n=1 Tax=Aquipseudomonas guryensis TaxID=2759165 RepID=A0A7W4DCA7_9GAMM|nr:hypothetical protein [Pseudomonas guryensis]MBB1519906.1 hypothetical protein [Pseudomonas guryensis]